MYNPKGLMGSEGLSGPVSVVQTLPWINFSKSYRCFSFIVYIHENSFIYLFFSGQTWGIHWILNLWWLIFGQIVEIQGFHKYSFPILYCNSHIHIFLTVVTLVSTIWNCNGYLGNFLFFIWERIWKRKENKILMGRLPAFTFKETL